MQLKQSFDDFVADEYLKYCQIMKQENLEPLDFDDWFKGSDFLEALFKGL